MPLVFEVYLYIGITSLCLYSNSLFPTFQDGMLSKKNGADSCIEEKLNFADERRLTEKAHCGMLNVLGRSEDCPIFA